MVAVRPGSDRLTAVNSPSFKSETCALFEGPISTMIIDFSGVSFIDSSGLGALVGIMKRAGIKGEVVVCGLEEAIAYSFQITRMDKVFKVFPNMDAAVQTLSERP
ncbi:STAS domain-containing protein [Pseudoprimorskyibacter insulae]